MGQIPSWFGTQVCDRDGSVAGRVVDVYYDDATSRPAWLLLDAGTCLTLVPATGSRSRHGDLLLAQDRAVLDAAPQVAQPPGVLAGEALLRLARHYGVRVSRSAACSALRGARVAAAA